MKESVAISKEADAKKGFSPTRSGNSIHRVRNEPERQLGSLRAVISNIRRNGGTPSVDSIATELSSMHTAQRASVLLALQRTHGNRYVQRVVTGIQAKLKIGQPNDIYEQEADRIAELVMRMPEPQAEEEEKKEDLIQTKPFSEQITPLVQRQIEPEEEDEEMLQTTPLAGQIIPLVQRQVEEEEEEEEEEILLTKEVNGETPEVTLDFESRIQVLKGGGQPLPDSVRAYFEPRFGYDLSQVRVHSDTQAAEALNAKAFAIGKNLVFGEGQYSPQTSEGKQLLAHELTHVVQQGRGQGSLQNIIQCVQIRRPTVGDPYFIYELDRAISNYTPLARYYGTTTSRIRAANPGISPRLGAKIRVPALNPPAPVVGMSGRRGQLGKITSRVDIKWSPHADSNKIGRLPRESYIPEVFSVINGYFSLFVDPSSLQDRADGIVTELTARGLISGPSNIGNHVLGYAPAGNVRRIRIVPAPEALAAVSFASAERGVVEDPPCKNLGSDVEKYLSAVGLEPRIKEGGLRCGWAWCAAFVRWCLNQAGVSNALTGAASSVRTWGERRGWYHEISNIRPIEGDIFYIAPGDTSPSGDPCYIPNHPCDTDPCVIGSGRGTGHCGFILSVSGNTITTIEGNVHICTTNDGVASKTRNISQLAGIVRISP